MSSELVPAAISRRPDGTVVTTVAGAPTGCPPSVVSAVADLCAEAIRRGQVLVVTVLDGARVRHLTISPDGAVRDAAPPVEELAGLGPSGALQVDLGVSAHAPELTRVWVEDLIGAAAAPPRRRRGLFRRR